MSAWTLYTVAFAAVMTQAYLSHPRSRFWYLQSIVPLLYGGVVAWMFLEEDPLQSLQVMLFGSGLPILMLVWAWWDSRREDRIDP
ncbi:MAG: hypothetical protein ACOX7N_00450 [Lawsonibacter sp.]